MMYSRTPKVLGGIQYTMNSSKTQVNKKIKSLNKRLSSLSKRLTNNAPVAISSKNGNTGRDYYTTRGKERVSNVTVLNKDFNVTDVFINPANSSLFPWLSGLGKKYDLYRFKRLRFSYVPSLPTSEEGNVYIGLDYNTLDPAPTSSTELCQLSHWTMNVVWKPSSIVVDLNNLGWLYTRQGPVANADYKTYDLGRIFFATEGITFSGIVGYVEVEYDVEFKRRQPDYVGSVITTPDVYPPFAFLVTNTMPASGQSEGFTADSYVNSSVFSYNPEQGYYRVTKPVMAFMSIVQAGTGGSSPTRDAVLKSSDNSNYATLANSASGCLLELQPGTYYKFQNTSGSSTEAYRVSLLVVNNL